MTAPIGGGGASVLGKGAAKTVGKDALKAVTKNAAKEGSRDAAEQAAKNTGKRQLSGVAKNAANNIGDDTAKAAHNACNGAGCFVADTPVLMADGTAKPIQDVQVGDQVTAYDPDTDTTQACTVTDTYVHKEVATLVVTLADGGSVETTATHPFWTKNRGWTPAGHLKPGDQLHTPDDTWVTVTSVEATGQTRTVYNLEVEDLHTYHVRAGDTWTTVHNSGCDMVRMRHYTSKSNAAKIMEDGKIIASDQNKVFLTKAKGKPMSVIDAEQTLGIGRGKGRAVIETDVPADRIITEKNPVTQTLESYVVGDLELSNPTLTIRVK